jgi:hypothetical protein
MGTFFGDHSSTVSDLRNVSAESATSFCLFPEKLQEIKSSKNNMDKMFVFIGITGLGLIYYFINTSLIKKTIDNDERILTKQFDKEIRAY